MRHRNCKQQCHKAGALISALFITTIAAMISVALAMQQQLLIHEGELVMRADQGYLNLQSLQQLAETTAETYASQWMTKNPPTQIMPLPTTLPKIKINNMTITGTIDDEQGKFNINDLIYSANQPRLVALLQATVPGISKQTSYNIAKSITAWMTNNSQDPYYLSLHPAYRSSQTEMVNISELRLVAGITSEIFTALEPYVTALPVALSSQNLPNTNNTAVTNNSSNTSNPPNTNNTNNTTENTPITVPETAININSASAHVLLTTNPALTLAQAQSLVECRKSYGEFSDTQTFIADCATRNGVSSLNNITTQSTYFLAQIQGKWGRRVLELNSLLVTQPQKNNTLKVIVVWQEFE